MIPYKIHDFTLYDRAFTHPHSTLSLSPLADTLFYGSIASFVAGLLLLMAFASPYWLVSWEDTQSPFKNMGLWEFCFYKFRHPDYQFDKLFTGCHALYGTEYRLIREKLLPGWLMVVQLFVTIALIFSFVGQLVQVRRIHNFTYMQQGYPSPLRRIHILLLHLLLRYCLVCLGM